MEYVLKYLDRGNGCAVKNGVFAKCSDKTILPLGAKFISDIIRDGESKLPILLTVEAIINPYHFKIVGNGSVAKDTCFFLLDDM